MTLSANDSPPLILTVRARARARRPDLRIIEIFVYRTFGLRNHIKQRSSGLLLPTQGAQGGTLLMTLPFANDTVEAMRAQAQGKLE